MPAFQVQDTCYPDAASALEGWKAQFPTPPDSTGAMWYWNAATINATTGAITGTLKKSTATTTTNITGITLKPCEIQVATNVFDKMPVQDVVFVAALILALILGFGQGDKV